MNRKTRKAIDDTIAILIEEYYTGRNHNWEPSSCPLCQVFANKEGCIECPLNNDYTTCLDLGIELFEDANIDTSLCIGALEGLKQQPQALEE